MNARSDYSRRRPSANNLESFAYEEGMRACREGKVKAMNPWPYPNGRMHQAWRRGWDEENKSKTSGD